jgi:release factor glutamine methyltransferase
LNPPISALPGSRPKLFSPFILDCERSRLWAHPEQDLTPQQFERWAQALASRESGLPTQYITGVQEFWGMKFRVSPDVLIPRPETEHLIETVVERLCPDRVLARSSASPTWEPARAASRLARQGTAPATIEATDISAAALEVARANAARHGFERRIRFRQCDLLGDLPEAAIST